MMLDPLAWRARVLVDGLFLAAAVAALYFQGAPGWAYTLLAFLATRVSRLDLAADLAALQGRVQPPQPETKKPTK